MSSASFKNESDESLMKATQFGNKQAFEELYERYADRLMGYFYRMLRHDKELAEDYTHEVFLKVMNHKKNFDASKNFKTWIFSIANNMCKNNYRSEEVRTKANTELSHTQSKVSVQNTDGLDKKTFKLALEKALNELNEAKRSSFILRFKHGLSINEIAEMEEVSSGTIKSRLFYTLKELTVKLKAFNPKIIQDGNP